MDDAEAAYLLDPLLAPDIRLLALASTLFKLDDDAVSGSLGLQSTIGGIWPFVTVASARRMRRDPTGNIQHEGEQDDQEAPATDGLTLHGDPIYSIGRADEDLFTTPARARWADPLPQVGCPWAIARNYLSLEGWENALDSTT